MIQMPLENITQQTLEELCLRGVSEGRTLEFKRDLPGSKDKEIKEFLADATSFANTQGGDLIFGVADHDGVAGSVPGVDPSSIDDAILRLESLLQNCVEPRLLGAHLHWVALAKGGAIVLRIPASLAAPHRVTFQKSNRFYARNSRGKYEMDTHELREAFTAADRLPARIRNLHDAAGSGEKWPFRLFEDPRAIVSVIPLTVFREQRELEVTPEVALAPVKPSGGLECLHTLDGILMHTPVDPDYAPQTPYSFVRSYALTYRQGWINFGWTIGGEREVAKGVTSKLVWAEPFEKDLLGMTIAASTRLRQFGLEGPWVVLVTFLGVEGYELIVSRESYSQPAWRSYANLPEVVTERIDEAALLPLFKSFWLLFGLVRPVQRRLTQNL